MVIKIFGSSDDLIEIRGDYEEEFQAFYDEPNYLCFSDGTIVKAVYNDEGEWDIFTKSVGENTHAMHDKSKENDYSDEVVLEGYFEWIALSNNVWRIP